MSTYTGRAHTPTAYVRTLWDDECHWFGDFRLDEYGERVMQCLDTCADLSADDLKAMRALWENRKAIREKLEMLSERCKHLSSPEPKIIEAALALLEKGGEG